MAVRQILWFRNWGFGWSGFFRTEYGSLIPEVSAAWLHDFDIDDRVITVLLPAHPVLRFDQGSGCGEERGNLGCWNYLYP